MSSPQGRVRQDLEVSGVDRTYFAPAGLFEPGEDDPVVDASGNSRISIEDAIASVEELENPKRRGSVSRLADSSAEAGRTGG